MLLPTIALPMVGIFSLRRSTSRAETRSMCRIPAARSDPEATPSAATSGHSGRESEIR